MVTTDSKKERLLEAEVAALAAAGGRMNIVVLNKTLFYADLVSLLERGVTITGTTYVALPQGPVVAKYDRRLVRDFQDAGYGRQLEDGMSKPVVLEHPPETFHHLDDESRAIIGRVASKTSRFTSNQASDFSHHNPGWVAAYDAGLGASGPAKPINLVLAMQQLAEHDQWLDEDPSPEVEAAFASAATGATRPWSD